MRHRTYGPRDAAPQDTGEVSWNGVYLNAEPSQLNAGYLADGQNLRCRTGRPTTRRGLWKPAWLNRINVEQILPWGSINGQPAEFRDPNGITFLMLAADDRVYAIRPYNVPFAVALPAGIRILTEVCFVAAFNKLFMLRGEKMAPLVLDDLDDGFEDMIARWDSTLEYPEGSVVAWGPWVAGDVTQVGGAMLVTGTAPHKLITGSDVQIRKTDGGRQDGRYTVEVLDEFIFSVRPLNMSSVGLTCEWSNNSFYWMPPPPPDVISPGDEPGVHPAWKREYLVMPNCTNGIFVNNRLMVTTSWIPDGQFVTGDYGAKRDFVAASYVLDYTKFAPSNEFRINQGSADELQCLVKIGDSAVLALKDTSVGLLTGVTGDLSLLTLEMIIRNYGVVNSRAAVEIGKDVVFMSPRRGLVSLRQTEQNKIQGTETAFSNPVKQWIDQIDWTLGSAIRLGYWNDSLYVAAPVGSTECLSANLVAKLPFTEFLDLGAFNWVRAGQAYRWRPDPGAEGNEVLLCNGKHFIDPIQPVDVVWDGDSTFGIYRNTETQTDLPSLGTLQRVHTDVNSAVLVFDFQLGAWQPIDRGQDLCVREFFVMTIDGVERLCCITADNYLNIYEEAMAGDRVFDPASENLISHTPIHSQAVTRGYTAGSAGFKAGQFARLVIATQAPIYSVATRSEGVEEQAHLVSNRTRDPRVYDRPPGAPRWVADNSNKDFNTPWRQDYSVYMDNLVNPLLLATPEQLLLSSGVPLELAPKPVGFDLAEGVAVDLLQEANHPLRMTRPRGRWHQAIVSNEDGLMELRTIELELTETDRQQGIKV